VLGFCLRLKDKIIQNFVEEKENWILWLPAFLGFGMWSYFVISFEPNIKIVLTILLTSLSIVGIFYFFIQNKKILLLSTPIIALILGFFLANQFAIHTYTPRIEKLMDGVNVYGKVENIKFYNKYGIEKRVIIKVFKIKGVTNPPAKIRLNVRNNITNIKTGDIVRFRAKLIPLGSPVYPNSYDFSKRAYFDKIGATGQLVGWFEVIKSGDYSFSEKVDNLQNKISDKILKTIDQPEAGVAIALLVGERGLIQQDKLEDMQYSGLAHLIAISGLHMVIVVLIFFGLTRFLLSRSQKITLNYDIKKTAAVMALIGGFAYLIITGMPISAKRAYVMIALMLTAIIIDRQPTAMRSLALAAIIILCFNPYIVTSPSFQMSFSAVVGLITGFGILKQYGINLFGRNIFTKFLFYMISVLVGSIVAEIFISPISMYHFNNYTPYNMLANLVAMPLTSFFVMPMGIISFPAMALGIENLTLTPMSWGISWILEIAHKVVTMENSVFIIGQLPPTAMFLFTIGGMWLCFWKRAWRFFAIIPVAIGLAIVFTHELPDIIIDEKAKFFAVKDDDGKLYFSKQPRSNFKEEIIREKNGEKELRLAEDFPKWQEGRTRSLSCGKQYCVYRKGDKRIYFMNVGYRLDTLKFEEGSIIVDMSRYGKIECKDIHCKGCKLITKKSLRNSGTKTILIKNNKFIIENAKDASRNRPW
jgi:competence protein ComEC